MATTMKNNGSGINGVSGRLKRNKSSPRVSARSPWSFYKSILNNTVEKAALESHTGSTGGYAIPVEYSELLIQSWAEASLFRPRATIVPMNSKTVLCPRFDTNPTASAGMSPYFGGFQFQWEGGDGVTLTETPTSGSGGEPFGQIQLTVRDLIGVAKFSNQLIMDMGESGEKQLTKVLGQAAAYYEQYAFFNGSGTNEPLGIINAPGTISVTRSSSGEITVSDVANMSGRLLPVSWRSSIWVCSPSALTSIAQMDNFVHNANGTLEDGQVGHLACRPLFVSDALPALNTKGDLILFDPVAYAIGDREQVSVDKTDLGSTFITNQTLWRVWLRVDGKPIFPAAPVTAAGSTTSSAYIVLTSGN